MIQFIIFTSMKDPKVGPKLSQSQCHSSLSLSWCNPQCRGNKGKRTKEEGGRDSPGNTKRIGFLRSCWRSRRSSATYTDSPTALLPPELPTLHERGRKGCSAVASHMEGLHCGHETFSHKIGDPSSYP
jgi:hypothetical protein